MSDNVFLEFLSVLCHHIIEASSTLYYVLLQKSSAWEFNRNACVNNDGFVYLVTCGSARLFIKFRYVF